MEETNALLSNLVQTKSVQKVLAPIAAKLSQLIIINEEFENGQRSGFPSDPAWSSSVLKATENFVEVARRMGRSSPDRQLQEQMPLACDALSVAAESFVTAQQRVVVENYSLSSRRHLIRTAKDILEGTIKVFLIDDDAQVRKIVRSISWVNDRLGVLTAVKSMKNLVKHFKAFTESLMLLINLLKKRQAELVHPRQREGLLTHMDTLRKLVPMLSSALQTYVRYSENQQAKASRDYVVGSVIECVSEIEEIVRNPNTQTLTDPEEEEEHPGHFINTVDKIIDILSEEKREEEATLVGEQLDLLIETVVRHSMAVAHLASAHHRNLIVTNSQRVMHQRSSLATFGQNHNENPSYEELSVDFNEACDLLEREVTDLERHVNSAILHLVVAAYSETSQPMERLVKAALKPILDRECLPESESEDLLEPYIASFHTHSDRMCQVGRFLAASSAEARRVRILRSCISLLEKLDPELVPATIACRSDIHNKAAVEHLRLLKREWTSTVNTLVSTVDEVTDARDFIDVSELEIRETVSRCKNSLYSEMTDVAEVTRLLIGQTYRATQVAKTMVEKHDDAVFRNGVMVYLGQLNKVLPAIKTSANHVLNNMGELRLHETLHKRADTALALVAKTRAALDGDTRVELMSPSRIKAREPEHLKALNDLLAECELDENDAPRTKTHSSPSNKMSTSDMKLYIAELTDSRLMELKKSYVTAAVGGNQRSVDLLANDVLVRTNHIVELATSVGPHSKQHQKTLSDCCFQLSQITPKLIDLAQCMASGDVNQVEPLHQTADKWAGTLTYLEGLVDGVLSKWVQVGYKVVDAAKCANLPLLKAQVQQLDEHRRQVNILRDLLADGPGPRANNSSVGVLKAARFAIGEVGGAELIEAAQTQEQLRLLNEQLDDFENQTAMLGTVADILSQSDNAEEKAQLERSAREWAGAAFVIAALVDKLAEEALSAVRGGLSLADYEDNRQLKATVHRLTEDTVRLKDVVSKVVQGLESEQKRSAVQEMLDDIDVVVSAVAECGRTLTAAPSPLHITERLYAPLRMSLRQWQWAVKVQEMWLTLDDVTLDYSLQIEQMLKTPRVTGRKTSPDPSESVADLHKRVNQTVAKVTEALTPLRDMSKRSVVQHDLADLSNITQSLVSTVQSYTDTPTEQGSAELRWVGRTWACKAQTLMYSLSDISAVESSVVKEAQDLLKGPVRFSSSTPGICTDKKSESRVANSILTSTKVDSTTVIQTPTSSAPATRNSSVTKLPSPTRSPRRVTFDKMAYGERETQTITTYIADTEVFEPQLSGSDHETKIVSPCKSGLATYQELAATPRVQHRRPEPPSASSGFRPPARQRKNASFDTAQGRFNSEADKWEEEQNPIVRVAKEMTQHLRNMTDYARGKEESSIASKQDLIVSAKSIAKNGETLVKFAKILAKYCTDSRCSKDLHYCADMVPMVATQLSILSSVKAASSDDRTTERMLVQNAENLLSAVSKMLTAAEAASVKGFHQPPSDALDETEAVVLATRWRGRVSRHRRQERSNATMDELGLRRVLQPEPDPALHQMVNHD